MSELDNLDHIMSRRNFLKNVSLGTFGVGVLPELGILGLVNAAVEVNNTHPLSKDFNYPVEIKDKSVADLFVENQIILKGSQLMVGDRVVYTFNNPTAVKIIRASQIYSGYLEVQNGEEPFGEKIYFGLNATDNTLDQIKNGQITKNFKLPEKTSPIKPEQKRLFGEIDKELKNSVPSHKIKNVDRNERSIEYELTDGKIIYVEIHDHKSAEGVKVHFIDGDFKKVVMNGVGLKGGTTHWENPAEIMKNIDLQIKLFCLDLTNSKDLSNFLMKNTPQHEVEIVKPIDFDPNGKNFFVDESPRSRPDRTDLLDFIRVKHEVQLRGEDGDIQVVSNYHPNLDNNQSVLFTAAVSAENIFLEFQAYYSESSLGAAADDAINKNYPFNAHFDGKNILLPKDAAVFREALFKLALTAVK
jgi:hypothetical protein